MPIATEQEERALVEAAQADPRRFADLYETHFDRVYAFVIRRVRDRSVAQDLTSQVFHDALANIGKFEWRGKPFASWLYRIAGNAVADHLCRVSREGEMPANVRAADVDFDDIERRARVFRLVRELSEDQRRVIVMRFVEQKSIREIAEALQRSEGAIKQLQFRGIENLRARMGEHNG